MTHIISFRRPELFYVLSKMTVPPGADVVAQIHHLEDLGYTIVDVAPPLGGYGPPQRPELRLPQQLSLRPNRQTAPANDPL